VQASTAGVYMREPQVRRGGSGSLGIHSKGRASAKLRGQGWAGATADTEGATWTPTPGPTPLLFIFALNRPHKPFRRLPGIARPGLSVLSAAHDGRDPTAFLREPTAIDRESCRLACLHDTM
jgi:hypothetical protein